MIRWFFLLFAALWMSSPAPLAAQGVQLPGSMDWLLSDDALWTTPAADMPEKYKSAGYAKDPMSSAYAYLGTPKELMEKKAHLFLAELAVWKVTFSTSEKVRSVVIDFMPPPAIAKLPDRAAFRVLVRRLEDGLKTKFNAAGVPGVIDFVNETPGLKWTCQRWTSPRLQAVLTTVAMDKGSLFTPQRLELKLLPSLPPGQPGITKPPSAKPDRITGAVILEGVPPQEKWDGHLPHWLALEQALHAAGKPTDRNTIIDCIGGTGYPSNFAASIRRIATASGAKVQDITPFMHTTAEMDRLAKSCDAAAKKLGKHAPEKYLHFSDIDPEVLRAARTAGSAVPAFTAAIKTALAAGRPLYWYGWVNYYPQNPREEGAPVDLTTRLIIGYAAKENEVIFADAAGLPGVRMKAADAFSAALWTIAVTAK